MDDTNEAPVVDALTTGREQGGSNRETDDRQTITDCRARGLCRL